MGKDAKDLLTAIGYFSIVTAFSCVAIYHWGSALTFF